MRALSMLDEIFVMVLDDVSCTLLSITRFLCLKLLCIGRASDVKVCLCILKCNSRSF